MTFDVDAARQVADDGIDAEGTTAEEWLLSACGEIEHLRAEETRLYKIIDEKVESVGELVVQEERLRNQLGIAAVALGRIADIGDPVKGTGFSPRAQEIAREALLRMREDD